MRDEGESSQAATSVLIQHNRYRKILKRRVSKTLQDIFFRFFNYIFSMAPSTKLVITIFRYIIVLQFMGAALQITNSDFWGTSSTMAKILRIFSVVISLDPSGLSSETYSLVVLVVSIVSILTCVYLFSTMYYFNSQAKLSKFTVISIALLVGCYMPYMIFCSALYLAHEIDSLVINGSQPIAIANIVLCSIVFVIFFLFHTYFVPSILVMRPTVTMIFFVREAQLFILANAFSIFLAQIGSSANELAYEIVAIFAILGDIVVFLICLRRHAWLSDSMKQFFAGLSIINMCFRIIIPIISILGKNGHEVIVILYLVLVIINIIRGPIMERNATAKILMELENYTSIDFFDEHSHRKIAGMLKTGFFHGHVKTHSWKYIDEVFLKYPSDRSITILYARFAAIYPDEIERVRDATMRLIAIKKHDIECKKLISDLQSLLQLRERNLTKGLKRQLNKVKEKSDRCISQSRRIWECVIRGSTSEIDSLSRSLQNQSKAVAKEYSQLLLIYPNNPFVARSYSQFMQTVMCDLRAANDYNQIYQSLKVGKQLQIEKGYYFAITEVPTLPTDKEHSQLNMDKQIPLASGSVKITGGPSQASFLVGLSSASIGENLEGGGHSIEISPETQYVENSIASIKLPSMKVAKSLIFFMHVIVCLATTIPFLIIIPNQVKTEIGSALGLHDIATIYSSTMQTSLFTMQYAGSVLGYMPTMKSRYKTLYGEDVYNKTDEELLLEMIHELTEHSQEFEQLLPVMKETGFFSKSLDYCFNLSNPIDVYTGTCGDCGKVTSNFSMQSYILYVIKTATSTIEKPTETFNATGFYTITHGLIKLRSFWMTIMNQMVNDAVSMFEFRIDTVKIMLIFDLIFVIILDIVIMCIITYLVQHEKKMIANAFKAIPKRSISQIVQKLNKALNKNIENDNEKKLDTQEENALRILSTSNTNSRIDIKLAGYFITPQIVLIICFVIIFCFLYLIPIKVRDDLSLICPQFLDLVSAPTAFQSTVITVLRYRLKSVAGFNTTHPDVADYKEVVTWIRDNVLDGLPHLINGWWFGNDVTAESRAANGGDDYINMFSSSECNITSFLKGIVGTMLCSSIETSAYAIIRSIYDMFDLTVLPLGDLRITTSVLWTTSKLIPNVVLPGIEILEANMNSKNHEIASMMITPVVIMIIIVILLGFYAMFGMDLIADATVGTIRLFLQADPHDILNSKAILKILSNDFSSNDDDSLTKDTSFYEMLVSNLLDGTVFMDNNLNILSANQSVENILGVNANDVIGKKLEEMTKAPEGKEQSLNTFFSALHTAMNAMRSPRITMEAEIERKGEPIMVEFNVIAVSLIGEVQTAPINREGLAMVIVVMKDTTPQMTAKRLLDEEHEKGEHLLKMILPDIIVRKLQRGESNISFSVPSASILFMDIVSFTPWCGSLPAKTVMATLNKMFKMFDTALSRYDKMIKIKCIGDCYMAAGGIFDEVNNPAIHAKQAISFCLDAINGLSLFDIENKMQLRIRAGINCGGPIIAGVLGIEKPTFDILGSAISVAAAMEHHGVPMNVHIPQHMYDLVYDQDFVFKERGDVEIKEKMIHTYLVSGYTSSHKN